MGKGQDGVDWEGEKEEGAGVRAWTFFQKYSALGGHGHMTWIRRTDGHLCYSNVQATAQLAMLP